MKKNKLIILTLLMVTPLIIAACTTEGTHNDELLAQAILDFQNNEYDEEEASGKIVDGVREIDIKAYQFFWEPELIIVNKDEKIRLKISTEDVAHGFEIEGYQIPGYDIETKILKGKPVIIDFTADKKGSWEFICAVYCGAGHGEMKGIFVIR